MPGPSKETFSILLIFKFSPIVATFLVNSSSTVLSLSKKLDFNKLSKSPLDFKAIFVHSLTNF